MSLLKRFCARCGVEIGLEEASKLGNLCGKCYTEVRRKHEAPSVISLTLCRRCRSIRAGGKWLPVDLSLEERFVDRLTSIIKREVERACKLKTSLTITPQQAYDVLSGEGITISVTLTEGEQSIPQLPGISRILEVKPSFSICPTCLKVVGKKFDATIQLRGFNEGELEEIKALVNKIIVERSGGSHNIQTAAVWEEVSGGVDVKLPSIDVARRITNIMKKSFKVQIKTSYKDSGWDRSRGRSLRKLTILIRSRNTYS